LEKLAFVFPGVGSHYVGMAKAFYDRHKSAVDTFEEASDILNIDMVKMCFEASKKEELDKLENSQTALLTASVAMFRVYLEETCMLPNMCMGHSLGEYSALCCAGVVQFCDALQLVYQRGAIIKKVSAQLDGTMMWVINLDIDVVDEVCSRLNAEGEKVYVSAYDSPQQSSISGSTDSVMKAAKQLEEAGAIVYPLKMSGPFHSPLMAGAAQEMESVLGQFHYDEPKWPVIANLDARPYRGAGSVTANLSKQLVSPILWQASLQYLSDQGVSAALEVGPKDVLKFLIKKNTPDIRVFCLDNEQDYMYFRENVVLVDEDFLQTIGRCLGVATSTRNYNTDPEEYEEFVVKPYRKIEALYGAYSTAENEKVPSPSELGEALQLCRRILEGKKIPQPQQAELLKQRVLRNKIVNLPQIVGMI
jgi:[acyl-carrier-protein] S-malonyltransferase